MSMLDARASGAALRDPELPALEALLGPAAPDLLGAAVAPHGGSLVAMRPSFVDYWPGRRLHVRYDATVIYPSGLARETLAAVAGRGEPPPPPALPVEVGDGALAGVWRFPDDPYLPGLRAAVDEDFVRELLEELGIVEPSLRIDQLGYSPRSRGVIAVAQERPNRVIVRPGRGPRWARPLPRVYLKVRRPERAQRVRRAHEMLAGLLPAPRCLAARPELGVLALEPLPGEPLWDALVRGAPVPGAEQLLERLARLDNAPLDEPSARPTVSESVRMNARMLRAIVPERAGVLDSFIESFGDDLPQPLAGVHGDFHEVQLLLDPEGSISGLIDLDDAGVGQRIDDLAMLVGRLACFAETEPDPAGRVRAYVDELISGFSEKFDERELRRRAAGVALNHATGPFRFQMPGWRRRTHEAIDRARLFLADSF
jgi:aminoglycoside phosphotransferase